MFDRLFKNKVVEMRVVDEPKSGNPAKAFVYGTVNSKLYTDASIWRGPPEEEPKISQPTKLPIYWDIALETIIREGTKNVAYAFIAYKTATTLLRMTEHIVVTKVK